MSDAVAGDEAAAADLEAIREDALSA